jgi:medium-chain acyl-[acyl-carrier-protein] hydrolase
MSRYKHSAWITRRNDRHDARLRLFCFPHAGAGAVIYHRWLETFPAHIDVCAIEPPGRLARLRDPVPATLYEFVAAFDEAAGDLLDRPFAIFGYSLGALMAFEWARLIRSRRQLEPEHIIVAAAGAPQLKRERGPISQLPAPDFVTALEHRYGALDPMLRTDPGMLEMIVRIMRADLRMLEAYEYREAPPFACPIFALGGTNDPGVSLARLEAWNAQTTGSFRAVLEPGDHFFLRTRGAELAAAVVKALERGAAPTAVNINL